MNGKELYELFSFIGNQYKKYGIIYENKDGAFRGWYDLSIEERNFWRDLAEKISKRI